MNGDRFGQTVLEQGAVDPLDVRQMRKFAYEYGRGWQKAADRMASGGYAPDWYDRLLPRQSSWTRWLRDPIG